MILENAEAVQSLTAVITLFTSCGTMCMMFYALAKFFRKPHDTLEKRVNDIDGRVKVVEDKVNKQEERCKEQDDTNEVLIGALLALIEFEIQYLSSEGKPINEDLKIAKTKVHAYLAKK